jgi:L-alanine-DL-glutamate epimerase-like enolase superfamily enzyme
MKITAVRTTMFHDGPAADFPARGSTAANPPRVLCLVELISGSALSGRALTRAGVAAAVEALACDLLIGEDPRATMGLWERMGAAISVTGHGAAAHARAALDVAAWDLKARANDEPLWKTLGGSRSRANAHLHLESRPADTAGMIEWYRALSAATGIRSASLPASADPGTDLQDLARLRTALGAITPDSALMVHFDGTGWPGDAIRHVRTLESAFDLTWVRSPVRPGDFRGARRVADGVAAAVCMGRGFPDPSAYLPYFEHYAANILELDVALLGVSGSMQMADAAFGFELPVALAAHPGHLAVQLFSALPTSTSVAIDRDPAGSGVVGSTVRFEQGCALAGVEPGNGLVIDREALRAATVSKGSAQ